MKRTVSGLFIISIQVLIVGFFVTTIFNKDVSFERYVSTAHNENLDKIATSVSLLFKEEQMPLVNDMFEDLTLSDLPSGDVQVIDTTSDTEEETEHVSTPLVSIDASKYIGNPAMGFVVTENNNTYNLNDHEFDVVVAVVAGEFDKNRDDALAVVSVILNRCDSADWRKWAGTSPYSQVVKKGQFEVYFAGMYLKYMPGGSQYGTEKYNIAKQAVIDGLNGIRNNKYLGFRAWWLSGYSNKYIVSGGNRYGYN